MFPSWYTKAKREAESRGHVIVSSGGGVVRCTECDKRGDLAAPGAFPELCRPSDAGKPQCTGPKCTRVAVRKGLCHAHSQQAARGSTLHPLRPERPALESVSLRVPASVRAAVLADAEGAREALEAWADDD